MRTKHAGRLALVALPVLMLCTAGPGPSAAQAPDASRGSARPPAGAARSEPSPFAGKWSYRSFRSNPDLAVEPNGLLFGSGTMEIAPPTSGSMSGTLGGDGWQLALSGTITDGNPATIRFQGKGTIGGEPWVYDYLGFLVPPWPNSVDQRPAIVGTIVRTVPHSGGTATAGYVAQWIAVKQDQAGTGGPSRGGPSPAASRGDEGLRELETRWAAAVGTNNPDEIGRFFTDDFLFVGAGGILQDRAQHLDDFRSGRLKVESVTIAQITIHGYGDFAVVSTLARVKGRFGERDITGDYRFMDSWRQIEGRWLAVARQQTRIASPAPGGGGPSPGRGPERRGGDGSPFRERIRDMYLNEGKSDPGPRTDLRGGSSSPGSLGGPRPRANAPAGPSPATPRTRDRRAEVELSVDYETFRIGNHSVKLRTYNRRLVGPVLRVKAGETLHLTLRNKLPRETGGSHETNSFHDWNTTNLHFHGLHVAPQGRPDAESDNVLLELKPNGLPGGSVQKYELHIPANHVAGTFWYHAHKHGSAAAQVSSGMVGALIVERDDNVHNLDSVPKVGAAGEEILVLQQIPYLNTGPGGAGEIERSSDGSGKNEADMFGPGAWKPLKRYVTVNGERIPTITIAPGEVRRLRVIDAGQRESMRLQIERAPSSPGTGPARLPFHEIAVDGLPTGSIVEKATLDLFPGYRSDVLVQPPADASGEYYLVDANAAPGTGADGSPEPLKWVARIVVAGAPRTMERPDASELSSHRPDDLPPPTGTQYAFFGLFFPPPPSQETFYFVSRKNLAPGQVPDGNEYDPTKPRTLTLGKTETWFVGTRNGSGVSQFHPFHIHTNPFLIEEVRDPSNADVTAAEIGTPTWRDTLAMKQGYTYKLRMRYEDFTGSFVDHCHIIDHEDQGMMELVTIAGSGTPGPLPSPLTGPGLVPTAPEPGARGPRVLVFVKGSLCPHCMTQITDLAREIDPSKAEVVVVSAGRPDELKDFPKVPFKLVADPTHDLFRKYGAYRGNEPLHATVVTDRTGKAVLREVGEAPFTDVGVVRTALARATTQVAIAVRNTDTSDDDYLTWAPTPCQIRILNGTPGGPDLNVTLTNDAPGSNPDGGDVRFATTLQTGETAESETITVSLKQDGTPVNFFTAGFKASKLTPASLASKGRDAVIEVHQGDASGPVIGSTAVMVRVRKDVRTLTDSEIQAFLAAVNDLHRVRNRYEWYVLLHRLATGHGADWPDQAHRASAFIAWHRAFLLQFERELQQRYPYVALPYWVQGEAQPATLSKRLFSLQRLGTNTPGGDEVVAFDRLNPLYGWSIALAHDSPIEPTSPPMGRLRRAARDHNVPPATNYRGWSFFETLDTFKDFAPPRRPDLVSLTNPSGTNFKSVELDPHNDGHNNVGATLVWMQNCRESNADPVFWVFHCNHDYLWARWQREHGRFQTDGSDDKHYWPADAFADMAADRAIPLGHHLKDTMWPWDGTTGQQMPVQFTSKRPNVNTFGAFPQAPYPFQWPPADAMPRPADVIDYLATNPGSMELGFCYDEVRFGAARSRRALVDREAAPPTARAKAAGLALGVMKDGKNSPDVRLQALESLRDDLSPEAAEGLAGIVQDKEGAATLRAEALRLLRRADPKLALTHATEALGDPTLPPSVGTAAIEELGHMLHFTPLSQAEMEGIHGAFRAVLEGDGSPTPLRRAAVRRLAPMGDKAAEDRLAAWLDRPSTSLLPLPEVVSLLRFYPAKAPALRQQLASPNEEVVTAALEALYKDGPSAPERRRLAADRRQANSSRKAAIQSLMHDDSADGAQVLVDLARDASEDLELRAEALASLRVFLQRRAAYLPQDALNRLFVDLRAVDAGAADASELGALRQQAIDAAASGRR